MQIELSLAITLIGLSIGATLWVNKRIDTVKESFAKKLEEIKEESDFRHEGHRRIFEAFKSRHIQNKHKIELLSRQVFDNRCALIDLQKATNSGARQRSVDDFTRWKKDLGFALDLDTLGELDEIDRLEIEQIKSKHDPS